MNLVLAHRQRGEALDQIDGTPGISCTARGELPHFDGGTEGYSVDGLVGSQSVIPGAELTP